MVDLRNVVNTLTPLVTYGFKSCDMKKGIEVYYLSSQMASVTDPILAGYDLGEPLIVLPYAVREWSDFLTRHNCNVSNGDPRFHDEFEDDIHFQVCCGHSWGDYYFDRFWFSVK